MRHIELHILQSFPVACLNRDDLNSPKTAIFGGVQRARVSSQSWKRAIREMAKEYRPDSFAGKRSRLFISELSKRLENKGYAEQAEKLSRCIGYYLADKDSGNENKVKTLMFSSPKEFDLMAEIIDDLEEEKKNLLITLHDEEKLSSKDGKKKIKAAFTKGFKQKIKGRVPMDAADIALFGRMVANDHTLMVEGATMFSHALSTHKVDNEIDFFTAVDDLQAEEDAGAGMAGTLEFNSATYYRFAALNLDMLEDGNHLGELSREERKGIVSAFIRATLMAVPGARKNSMNANTLPGFVIGVVRGKGHPIQLINAFEKPLRPYGGNSLFEQSVEALQGEYQKTKDLWELDEQAKVVLPEKKVGEFIEKVVGYVR